MVAHDGFTLRDLYAFNVKNNQQPWPFGPSDGGEDNNISWDQGGNAAAQRQAARNGLAFIMLSAGVPMLTGGDPMIMGEGVVSRYVEPLLPASVRSNLEPHVEAATRILDTCTDSALPRWPDIQFIHPDRHRATHIEVDTTNAGMNRHIRDHLAHNRQRRGVFVHGGPIGRLGGEHLVAVLALRLAGTGLLHAGELRVVAQVAPENAPIVAGSVGGISEIEHRILTPLIRSIVRNVAGSTIRIPKKEDGKVVGYDYRPTTVLDLIENREAIDALHGGAIGEAKFGRATYYKNCVYCHGDNLRATGMFAHGLDPIPTNFVESSPLPQLTESFIFWRIAKGGPGLPEEGGPWDSAMPAWEKFLSEQEMWEVVLFLYDFTGNRPRALEEGHE